MQDSRSISFDVIFDPSGAATIASAWPNDMTLVLPDGREVNVEITGIRQSENTEECCLEFDCRVK